MHDDIKYLITDVLTKKEIMSWGGKNRKCQT